MTDQLVASLPYSWIYIGIFVVVCAIICYWDHHDDARVRCPKCRHPYRWEIDLEKHHGPGGYYGRSVHQHECQRCRHEYSYDAGRLARRKWVVTALMVLNLIALTLYLILSE